MAVVCSQLLLLLVVAAAVPALSANNNNNNKGADVLSSILAAAASDPLALHDELATAVLSFSRARTGDLKGVRFNSDKDNMNGAGERRRQSSGGSNEVCCQKVCTDVAGAGPCEDVNGNCASVLCKEDGDLRCATPGGRNGNKSLSVCQAYTPLQEGATCNSSADYQDCAAGLDCVDDASSSHVNTCRPRLYMLPGMPCTEDYMCLEGGGCVAGFCNATATGLECDSNTLAPCRFDAFCNRTVSGTSVGTCTSRVGVGEHCGCKDACIRGLICSNITKTCIDDSSEWGSIPNGDSCLGTPESTQSCDWSSGASEDGISFLFIGVLNTACASGYCDLDTRLCAPPPSVTPGTNNGACFADNTCAVPTDSCLCNSVAGTATCYSDEQFYVALGTPNLPACANEASAMVSCASSRNATQCFLQEHSGSGIW